MGASHFTELQCWQLAHELKLAVYAILDTPQAAKDRSLCDDLRRSARSAPANISEGFGRYTHREFAHFLSIAKASLTESENHLLDLCDIKGISQPDCARLTALAQRAQKAVSGLRAYLLRTPDPPNITHRKRRDR